MKNANKLYAAGGGLLIAALMGFGTSFADDGTQNALEAGVEPIEVATEAMPQGEDAFSLGDEAAKPVEATQTATPSETPSETPSAEPTESTTQTPKPEAEEPTAAEPAAEGVESATVEGEEAEPAGLRAAADVAESDVPAMRSESVNYVRARRSMVTSFSAAPMRPSPRAMAPMLTTASPYAQTTNRSNGDSQIIFFDLPEAAGPGLMPGAATPLLGTGISEFAPVNTNIVAPAAVQAASARYQGSAASAAAPAAAVGQSGNLGRSLARTGSVAQYASMLSIAALIIGVSMVGAAFATTRRRNMVDID